MSHLPIFLGILLFSGAVLSAIDRTPESNQKAQKQQTDAAWEEFKQTFDKTFYSDEHEEAHKEAFMKQLEVIKEHNEAFERGETSFKFGVSSLSDMTADERDQLLGFRFDRPAPPPTRFMGTFAHNGVVDVSRVPEELDWRKGNGSLKLVTSVKNQLHCGSCWAFSTVGALEAAHAKATGHLVDLSPQNLVDCDATNYGCQGGFPLMSLTFAIDQGGVNVDRAYPYVGVDAKCRFSNMKPVGASAVRQVVPLPVGDEKALMAALAQEGPISVAIQVTYNFQAYAGGVLNDRTCSNKLVELNHAVLLVGYGSDPKWGDYWLVKNSWGTSWGENGYIRMARNKNNQCGIATQAVFARN